MGPSFGSIAHCTRYKDPRYKRDRPLYLAGGPEIDVADRVVRIAAKLAWVAPGLITKATQRRETLEYADRLAQGLRHLR